MQEGADGMELILLDEDLDYAQSIRDFLQTWEGGFGITLKQFTKPEAAFDSLRRCRNQAILLIAEPYEEFVSKAQGPVFILADRPDAAGEHVLSKLLPLDQLLQEIRRSLSGPDAQTQRQAKGTRIAGWFSAAGGCGKSTAAYNLAMQLSQRGEHVCLIGLESFSSGLLGEPGDGSKMSEWLYFAKTRPALAAERAGTLLIPGPHPRMRLVVPFGNSADASDLNEAELKLLLNAIAQQRSFSWIVIDCETGWGPRQRGANSLCDLRFWIVTDDSASVNKTARLIDEWSRTEDDDPASGICWTAGKYVGVSPGGCERIGVEAEVLLPYVPRWKSVKRPEELLSAEFFSQQLLYSFQAAADKRMKGGSRNGAVAAGRAETAHP